MDDRIAEAAPACGPDGCDVAGDAPVTLATAPAREAARIDIVSDAICPWCWVGKRNLETALADLAAQGERFEIHWRPFQLNPDMPREGVERDSYRAAKFGSLERSRQLDAQLAETGRASGLEFRHDRMKRTPNTVDAHRVIRLAGDRPGGAALQNAVVEALFRAYFQEGRDIGDRAVLAEIAGSAGLDAGLVTAMLESTEGEAEVRGEDAGFRQMGLSGVPTFALAGHVLFSGAMPPAQMADAFRRALAVLRERGLMAA